MIYFKYKTAYKIRVADFKIKISFAGSWGKPNNEAKDIELIRK